jgi:hypothetical protein
MPPVTPSYSLTPFDESLWPDVLALADLLVPYDLADNRVFILNRERFGATGRTRRHYATLDESTGNLAGYGAIEQQDDDPSSFRVFIIPPADDAWDTVGLLLYDRLLADAIELGARLLWLREYEKDTGLVAFFLKQGFTQRRVMVCLEAPGSTDVSSLRPIVHTLYLHEGEQSLVCPEDARSALAVAHGLGFELRFRYVILEKRLD